MTPEELKSMQKAAMATRALADAGVNIEMMNQGSSEISMMFGVKAADRERARSPR